MPAFLRRDTKDPAEHICSALRIGTVASEKDKRVRNTASYLPTIQLLRYKR